MMSTLYSETEQEESAVRCEVYLDRGVYCPFWQLVVSQLVKLRFQLNLKLIVGDSS